MKINYKRRDSWYPIPKSFHEHQVKVNREIRQFFCKECASSLIDGYCSECKKNNIDGVSYE